MDTVTQIQWRGGERFDSAEELRGYLVMSLKQQSRDAARKNVVGRRIPRSSPALDELAVVAPSLGAAAVSAFEALLKLKRGDAQEAVLWRVHEDVCEVGASVLCDHIVRVVSEGGSYV